MSLRRSSRIAEKAQNPVSEVVAPVVPVTAPKKRIVAKREVARPPPVMRALTAEEMAHDLALRKTVLAEAIEIRKALGQARTTEDFHVCHDRADTLWHMARDLQGSGMDDFFLTDCYHYCRDAKLGHEDHSSAIRSIKYYMSAIQHRITSPPTSVIVHP